MSRVLFAVIVVLVSCCGIPHMAAATADEPDTIEARLERPASSDSSTRLLIYMEGPEPAPAVGAEFATADELGENRAKILSAPVSECESAWPSDEKPLATRHAKTKWCLAVTGLSPGSESTGEIGDTGGKVVLTVSVKHSFFWLPLFVAVLSSVLGACMTWNAVYFLPAYINRAGVKRGLKKNDGARVPVLGLHAWVKEQREAGVADAALRPILVRLLRDAEDIARDARKRLADAVTASKLKKEDYRLIQLARDEASRKTPKATDFYGRGAKDATHPADNLIELLKRAEHIHDQLQSAEHEIGQNPPEQLRMSLKGARDAAMRASDSKDLDDALALVRTLWSQIQPPRYDNSQVPLRYTGYTHTIPTRPDAVFPELAISKARRFFAVTLIVLAAVAIASAVLTTYSSKPTFGSWQDYIALIITAFTSAALAEFVALLILW